MQRVIVHHCVHPDRFYATLGEIFARGSTEGEALRALATLLRAHASQIETQADRASGEAALIGAAAGLSAGMVG